MAEIKADRVKFFVCKYVCERERQREEEEDFNVAKSFLDGVVCVFEERRHT